MHLKVLNFSLIVFHHLVRRTVSIFFTLGHVFRHRAIVGPALSDTLANTPRIFNLILVHIDTLQILSIFINLCTHSIEICRLSFSSSFNDIWQTSLMLSESQLRSISSFRYTEILIELVEWSATDSLGEDYFIVGSRNTMVVQIGRPDEAIRT